VKQIPSVNTPITKEKDIKQTNIYINKPLVAKPETSIISTPAATPITTSLALTNRFMTFSPEPNITFSSALASEYSPFLGPSHRPRMPFIKAEKPSAYIRLPYFQHLFFIELGMAPIKEPSQLALAYFPPRFHWVPEHPLKDISYYTTILVETKSAHFKPIPDRKTGKTLYMSVYFDKVLLLKDWGEHPSQPRMLANSELSYSSEQFQTFSLCSLPKPLEPSETITILMSIERNSLP
jgi:hypothetical protein